MNHLLTKVHSGVRPKQMMGRTLNGEMFCTLVESYVEALNSGKVPEVNSAWTRVIGTQCNEAKEHAMGLYDALLTQELVAAREGGQKAGLTLADLLPVDMDTLLMCHESAKVKCKQEYLSKVF
jgi:hypothetical protein